MEAGLPRDHTSELLSYSLYQLGRRIVRLPVLRSFIPDSVRLAVQSRILGSAINCMPDRRYMEDVILPAVACLRPTRLLDLGVEHYTARYGDWFHRGCERWTIDLDPRVAEFGSPGRHIIGNVLDMASQFHSASVDVIMMNGLFGYGIDTAHEQERIIAAAKAILRPNGWLLVGWDRSENGTPIVMSNGSGRRGRIKDPLDIHCIQKGFEHSAPNGLPRRMAFKNSSHVYDWFRSRALSA